MHLSPPNQEQELGAPAAKTARLCFVGPLMAGRHSGYVITQGVRLSNHFSGAGYKVIAVSTSPNRYMRAIDIMTTLIRRRRAIDILVVHVYSGASFIVEDLASWLGKAFGLLIIMLLHGGQMPEFMTRYPRWSQRVLDRADVIVAPSPFLARAASEHGYPVKIIPNVLDLPRYPYRHRSTLRPTLFWMRSFHPVYNPHMAVRVLARLKVAYPEATLVMGGQDKGLEGEVKALARKMGLGDAVRFPGFLDMEGKLRQAAACDIFLNTSHVDNMPVAVVEAGAFGLPVVSTNVGGVPDLLTDGETALLTPDGHEEAMCAAIVRLLKDRELAGRLSSNGRQLAERSDWDAVRPEWERLFGSLMHRVSRDGGGSRVRT